MPEDYSEENPEDVEVEYDEDEDENKDEDIVNPEGD